MSLLILDYFRRWAWPLALGAFVEFVFGLYFSPGAEDSLEFFLIWLCFLMGGWPISFDLERGLASVVAVLPLTREQIGRSRWLASVGFPAITLATLLFAGAGLSHLSYADEPFPAAHLAMASVVALFSLVAGFTIYSAPPRPSGGGWDRVRSILLAFFPVVFIGFLVFGQRIVVKLGGGPGPILEVVSKTPVLLASFLGVGALLTASSWFRAGQFYQARANFRLGAPSAKNPRGQYRVPGGFGGVPFLIQTTLPRTLFAGAAMVAVSIFVHDEATGKPPHSASLLQFWMFYLMILAPIVTNVTDLRFLRTLPLSAMRLASVLFLVMLLTVLSLGVFMAGAAGLLTGAPTLLVVLKSCALAMAGGSLCVFVAVWLGPGTSSAIAVLMLFSMLVVEGEEVLLRNGGVSFTWIGIILLACLAGGLALTRYALIHRSDPYRVKTDPLFGATFGRRR